MRLKRTLPPAASPIYPKDIISGLKGLVRGQRELERFKEEIRDYFGTKHCFLLSSGKAALTLILRALKDMHPHRDEVLIPAFTCYSVPSAIVRAGLKVRLCDINPDTLDFDFDQLSKILNQPNKPNEPNELNQPNQLNKLNQLIRREDPYADTCFTDGPGRSQGSYNAQVVCHSAAGHCLLHLHR